GSRGRRRAGPRGAHPPAQGADGRLLVPLARPQREHSCGRGPARCSRRPKPIWSATALLHDRRGEGRNMPSLLDLTSQGDVGTITDESKLASVTLMTPQQLYELWERQNWQSHTIDLSQDVRDWQRMDAELRSRLAWNLSSFFVGEERVTTQFSGLVMAYESQSEEAF